MPRTQKNKAQPKATPSPNASNDSSSGPFADRAARQVYTKLQREAALFAQITRAITEALAPIPPTTTDWPHAIATALQPLQQKVLEAFDQLAAPLQTQADWFDRWHNAQQNIPAADQIPSALARFLWSTLPGNDQPDLENWPKLLAELQKNLAAQTVRLRETIQHSFEKLIETLTAHAEHARPIRSSRELYNTVTQIFEQSLLTLSEDPAYRQLVMNLHQQYSQCIAFSQSAMAPWLQATGLPSVQDTQTLSQEIAALRSELSALRPRAEPETPRSQRAKPRVPRKT